MSVRELLAKARIEVINGNLTPIRTGELAAQLSALLGNIGDEQRGAEMAYNRVFAQCLDEHGKANRAEIAARLTPEYERLIEARNAEKVTLEMVRSLRRLQDTQSNEMRLAR